MAKASFQKISNLMTEKLRRKPNQDFDLPDVTFRPRRANRRSATESDEVVRGGEKRMKRFCVFGLPALLMGAAAILHAETGHDANAVVVTASNAATNQLLVYDTTGKLLQTVPTQGQGGVSGNAGGIATSDGMGMAAC
jgi:hypothetical protein